MDKTNLEQLISVGKSQRQIGKELNLSQTAVRYWLKVFGLKTDPALKPHKCYKCKETDPSKFYGKKKHICGACHNAYSYQQGRKMREKSLAYLGGKCRICGFSQYPCSLDCHHIDPKQKDPNFVHIRFWNWNRIEKELNKCILLCKNCHMAVHQKLLQLENNVTDICKIRIKEDFVCDLRNSLPVYSISEERLKNTST